MKVKSAVYVCPKCDKVYEMELLGAGFLTGKVICVEDLHEMAFKEYKYEVEKKGKK